MNRQCCSSLIYEFLIICICARNTYNPHFVGLMINISVYYSKIHCTSAPQTHFHSHPSGLTDVQTVFDVPDVPVNQSKRPRTQTLSRNACHVKVK